MKSGNGNCQVKYIPGVLRTNITYWVDANPGWPGIYYKKISGTCSAGGVSSGNGNCQIVALEKPNRPFVVANVSYWVDANPSWPGVYYKQINGNCLYGGVQSGGGNCQLVSFPAGKLEDQLNYWVDANPSWPGVYYRQTY